MVLLLRVGLLLLLSLSLYLFIIYLFTDCSAVVHSVDFFCWNIIPKHFFVVPLGKVLKRAPAPFCPPVQLGLIPFHLGNLGIYPTTQRRKAVKPV